MKIDLSRDQLKLIHSRIHMVLPGYSMDLEHHKGLNELGHFDYSRLIERDEKRIDMCKDILLKIERLINRED